MISLSHDHGICRWSVSLIESQVRPPHCRMAPTPPELYLSLLSGYGDVSHISTEPRHKDIGSRILSHPFGDNRFMDLLDALAATCVQKEKGETFFVSLAMDSLRPFMYLPTRRYQPPLPTISAEYEVSLNNSTTFWNSIHRPQLIMKNRPSHVRKASLSSRRPFMNTHISNFGDAF